MPKQQEPGGFTGEIGCFEPPKLGFFTSDNRPS